MKIVSWNMLYKNQSQEEAFEYVKNLEFDILCLQEVPESFLQTIKDLPYYIVYSTDVVLALKHKEITLYSVIVSRHLICDSGSFEMPSFSLPYRTRLLLKAKEGAWDIRKRETVFADIKFEGKMTRVFSVHLTLSGPLERKRELDLLNDYIPQNAPVIIAGDFNIIEPRWLRLYYWFTGASFSECMPWNNELQEIETYLQRHQLKNPLRAVTTHMISRSQLDKILVPQSVRVLNSYVEKSTYGSDHHPIFIDISI